VWIYLLSGAVGLALILWYAVAMAWAASVSKHRPDLRGSVKQTRYGWRCPRCGRVHAPACTVGNCGGPLVWTQQQTRIKCSRCHRYFIPHPMLFRQTPRPRRMWCGQCKSVVLVKDWKLS